MTKDRYTIRIKQIDTGCWRVVRYFDTYEAAYETAKADFAGYVWAIFCRGTKLAGLA